MIFAIGLGAFFIGFFMVRIFGAPMNKVNTADFIGVSLCFGGLIAMTVSVCMLLWKYVP